MAQRQRRRVGGIGRLRQRGQSEPYLHHLLHLHPCRPRPSRRRHPSPGSACTAPPRIRRCAASASASPLAWPTLIAVRTLTWKNTCSTATACGRELGDQRRRTRAAARRDAAAADRSAACGSRRARPHWTAPARPPSTTAYPQRVRPGSMPSTRNDRSPEDGARSNTGSQDSRSSTGDGGPGVVDRRVESRVSASPR